MQYFKKKKKNGGGGGGGRKEKTTDVSLAILNQKEGKDYRCIFNNSEPNRNEYLRKMLMG